MYSVFLVDDEHIVLDGIRNKLNLSSDFTFAGEASDGELALSMIREVKPDILITDIKMPFMDGLELARAVKRIQPWIRIIILSGHDEFDYAKEAIKIGVEDYILKPFTHEELETSLLKVAQSIGIERRKTSDMSRLKEELESTVHLAKNKFLSDLVSGTTDFTSALNKSQEFKIDLIARYYKITVSDFHSQTDSTQVIQNAKNRISALLKNRSDILSFYISPDTLVCIIKGSDEKEVDEDSFAAAESINHIAGQEENCFTVSAIGNTVDHLSHIPLSFKSAAKLLKMTSPGNKGRILSCDSIQKSNDVINKAKEFIQKNFASQDTCLTSVAESVHLSPNHFSAIFSQECGVTFIEYLTNLRIEEAKKLLLNTEMRSGDIAYECGFSDPHYFSFIFKKNTGLSPREFKNSR